MLRLSLGRMLRCPKKGFYLGLGGWQHWWDVSDGNDLAGEVGRGMVQ